ncbi:MAG TPA: hypothetical protein VGA75_01840 [Paracoccaceae bacterium]
MRSSLEIYALATGQVRVVLQTERLIEAPNWHPSGGWLLVNGGGRLWRVDLAAPALVAVETGFADRCNNDHGFSPDGASIALTHHTDRGAEIFLMPSGGGVPVAVTEHAPSWWHGWSPDGRDMVYAAARGGSRVVDIHARVNGREVRLTHGEGHSDGPEYSADGRWIYYNCDRTGHAQIWRMRADGTGQALLFADARVNWFPHPSPDGRHVLYLAYPPGTEGHPRDLPVELRLMDPDGGNRRRAVALNGGQGSVNVPCWAPDGSAFAFMRYGAEN